MLLRLTCPSCGRVEQASERVLGKEIRCPCGTQFRGASAQEARPGRRPSRAAAAAGASRSFLPPPPSERTAIAAARLEKLAGGDSSNRSARSAIPLEPERFARAAGSAAAPHSSRARECRRGLTRWSAVAE